MPDPTACIGNGLRRDSLGRLTIDTPASPFDCDPNRGEPLILDSQGKVRGAPRQEVVNTSYSEATPGFIHVPANGFLAMVEHNFSLLINNPDPCRRLRGVGIWQCRVVTRLGGYGVDGATAGAIRVIGGGDSAQEYFREGGAVGGRNMYFDFTRTSSIEILPGSSMTASMELAAQRLSAGATSTEVTEMRVALRVMAVSFTAG